MNIQKIKYTEGQKVGNCFYIKEITRDNGGRRAIFKCKCGAEFEARIEHVKNRGIKSCRCLLKTPIHLSVINTKHGECTGNIMTTERKAWKAMKSRCRATNYSCKPYYYDKGIKVCKRWIHSFENFLEDMGRKPTSKHTLDRIKGNKGYGPKNCRWITQAEQNRNTSADIMIKYKGKIQCLTDWSNETGIKAHTLDYRLKNPNWTIEKAFTCPVKECKQEDNK